MTVLSSKRFYNCRCDKCKYEWLSTKLYSTGVLPKQCPDCKSMKWNDGKARRKYKK